MLEDNQKYNETVKPNSLELELLKQHFPQYFNKEGEFLISKFERAISEDKVNLNKESFGLNFLGKSLARYLSSTKTETYLAPHTEYNSLELNKDSENAYIIGDNLDALKHLLGSYTNKIKCIYIDPPYNTGSDGFVYNDTFEYTAEKLASLLSITEEEAQRIIDLKGKSSHSAWLTFIYPRLILARYLLADDGVIFISIDGNEHANLQLICNELFSEENQILDIIVNKASQIATEYTIDMHEYILGYAKNKDNFTLGQNYKFTISRGTIGNENQTMPVIEFPAGLPCYGIEDGLYEATRKVEGSKENIENLDPIIVKNGKTSTKIRLKARWRSSNDMRNYFANNCLPTTAKINGEIVEIFFDSYKFNPQIKKRVKEKLKSLYLENKRGSKYLEDLNLNIFDNPKDVNLLEILIKQTSNKDSIILDFFSGSASTAHAVMQLNVEDNGNRKYILVQLPEQISKDKPAFKEGYKTIDEVGRKRIELAAQKIKAKTNADIDYGFKVYSLKAEDPNTLDKQEEFDPTLDFGEESIADFKTEVCSGVEAALTTYMLLDGYGLNATVEPYQLETYVAHKVQDTLYILDSGAKTEDLALLIERIGSYSIDINRIVIFHTALGFSLLKEFKTNLACLRHNRHIKLVER